MIDPEKKPNDLPIADDGKRDDDDIERALDNYDDIERGEVGNQGDDAQ